jgi:NADPH:quinone reductase-like Zn-dependent oxidoreductase
MRAFASDKFGEISELTLREIDKPTAGSRELVVNVRAAAVNPADLKVLGHRDGGSFLHASRFPLVLGYDYSGIVTEVGANSSAYKVGDEVYGFLPYARSTTNGTYAEYVAVTEAAQDLARADRRRGDECRDRVASAAQGEALRRPHRADQRRVGWRRQLRGPDREDARSHGDRDGEWRQGRLRQGSRRRPSLRLQDHAAARDRGAVRGRVRCRIDSSFGTCSPLLKSGGTYVALLPSAGLFLGMGRAMFTSKRCTFIIVKPVAADFARLGTWFDEGKIKPILDASYPLAELPAALERQRVGDIRGKLAITIDAPAS